MHERISKLLETFSKSGREKMLADASDILRAEAKFRFPTLQYHQDRIERLKDFLGWSARRTRSIYNAEEGVSLRGAETLRIEELKAAQEARKRRAEEAADAEGYRILEARFVAVEAELAALRAALAGQALDGARNSDRGKGGAAGGAGQGSFSRRSTDRQ
jgi:hypothetical protein